ncbi:hypothetical protein HZB01_04185 [Candidatus Woesearchaeota archaeon]|nr:hypothetical protein [Candidatus Woesearchaeota archaeon]
MGSTLYTIRYDKYATGRGRKSRPKTFATEEAAHTWAKANKIENYKLVNLKTEANKVKKIKVVAA